MSETDKKGRGIRKVEDEDDEEEAGNEEGRISRDCQVCCWFVSVSVVTTDPDG